MGGPNSGRRLAHDTSSLPTPTMHPSLPDPAEAGRRFADLSSYERWVLRHLARGWTPDQIAAHRCCSVWTVRTQVKAIRGRLGVDCTLRAVAIYHLARDPLWTVERIPTNPG